MNQSAWESHTAINRLQTMLLLGTLFGFMALLGAMLWGETGVWLLVGLAILLSIFSPAVSPALVMRLYRAKPLHDTQVPALYQALREISTRAQLTHVPTLYYIPSNMINAFAVGKANQSAIGITDGLLRQLSLREAVAVLGHEVSHIRNHDMVVMGIADLFSRLTQILSLLGQALVLINLPFLLVADVQINWVAFLILVFAPTLSALAQLGLSRTREFNADLNGARLTGDPEGLALALEKIERIQGGWLERIFMPGRRHPEPSLLRTHPSTEQRIERLLTLSGDGSAYEPLRLQSHRGYYSSHIPPRPRWHIHGLWF
ncbi:MAG: zinc metalloprotease HtpX, partial [Pseudomonadales bacterium]|nr:zinc metalloprotease HtpX [Pseudomonadales bacterium]